jgi:hypothetical protein
MQLKKKNGQYGLQRCAFKPPLTRVNSFICSYRRVQHILCVLILRDHPQYRPFLNITS